MMEKLIQLDTADNAKDWARRFKARFLEAGIVSYENIGCGKALLTHETIAKYANTFVGRPVIVQHQHVTPQTMEPVAQGYIAEVWHDPEDGWWWCAGTVHKDEAKELISRGYSVSCSYQVTGTASGGEYHAIKYEEEITGFSGMHLAIVDNPRYERAKILLNSKTSMFKLIKKLIGGEQKETASPEDISGESVIETAKGTATVAALVEKWNAADASGDKTVDVDGKAVKINELVAAYKANKKNDDDSDDDSDDKKGKAVGEIVNADDSDDDSDDEKKAKKADKKDNSKGFFKDLLDARDNAVAENVAKTVDTVEERQARAKERYGKPAGK
jgi:hypothetical protein